MQGKEYLEQIRLCKNNINNNLRRLDERREMALATGSKELKADVVQSSISNAGLEDSVGRYVDYESSIREEINKYMDLKNKINKQIEELNAPPQYVELLMLRYCQFKRFEQIAVEMDYSYERVRHMHKEALIKFENQYLKGV